MYIKRKLNKELQTFKNLRNSYKNTPKSSHRYIATVGLGGNIGDVKRRFIHLYNYLKKDKQVALLQTSLILKNPPFGFVKQDDFFNAVMMLKTSMQPKFFLDYLMRLEKKFARKRSFANAPRTLDLDIIFFDNRVVKTQKLQIPHAKWFERESVLIPLMDLQR
ncbi:2-amino-4-hydroxy-6-hydroxymethyldihydropteridine diphosphokinase [Sulfurimonas sp.]|jgi:2-amino-4-hydroxy-6-hydroxymethyldihydropteridine diphosphokinase|uniref:2-amino-4-hydroxy-6- hydroxymethyldihydropteridine diphosphokinase n=1 Tax=Sulfurimonas sp. TaxID=2022749 RepID=UPI0025E03A00|nr:2-amino-4-hydroxy-6-hydroxymethyldihydropteridine diphosphokinase [Sulfurimonas sp.]MCK9473577.1 2-amino-4-hydroxy-6-hydroxymethyldihydropteridine diphosphokinase [Sulfurimonas sp.]MDD3506207.1 2-amino-4-hydroxy-6-hydroxymethyldihydropteridine diphosphokinase [Sulfurimonas sp.]